MIGGLRAPGAPEQAAHASRGSIPQPPTTLPSLAYLEHRRIKCCQPALLAAAETWWQTCRRTTSAKDEEILARDEYVRLNCCLYRALVPITWDEERAVECAMQDWRNDAGSDVASAISKHIFFSSVFELADAWSAPLAQSAPTPADLAAAAARDAAWLDGVFETIAVKDGPTSFAWNDFAKIECLTEAQRNSPVRSAAATPVASPVRRKSKGARKSGSLTPSTNPPSAGAGLGKRESGEALAPAVTSACGDGAQAAQRAGGGVHTTGAQSGAPGSAGVVGSMECASSVSYCPASAHSSAAQASTSRSGASSRGTATSRPSREEKRDEAPAGPPPSAPPNSPGRNSPRTDASIHGGRRPSPTQRADRLVVSPRSPGRAGPTWSRPVAGSVSLHQLKRGVDAPDSRQWAAPAPVVDRARTRPRRLPASSSMPALRQRSPPPDAEVDLTSISTGPFKAAPGMSFKSYVDGRPARGPVQRGTAVTASTRFVADAARDVSRDAAPAPHAALPDAPTAPPTSSATPAAVLETAAEGLRPARPTLSGAASMSELMVRDTSDMRVRDMRVTSGGPMMTVSSSHSRARLGRLASTPPAQHSLTHTPSSTSSKRGPTIGVHGEGDLSNGTIAALEAERRLRIYRRSHRPTAKIVSANPAACHRPKPLALAPRERP